MIDLIALQTEIFTDPTARGYAPHVAAGADSEIADLLNAPGAGAVQREIVASHEIFEALAPSEWAALSAAEKQRVQTILAMAQVNLRGANTRAALAVAFGAGTTTRTNLLALQTRPASRAEILFGAGVSIHHLDVAHALRGGS